MKICLLNIAELLKKLSFKFTYSNLFIKISVNLEILFWVWLCITLGLIREGSLRFSV